MSLTILMDKDAIAQVYHRYCDIVDSKTFDAMDEVFTADCVATIRRRSAPVSSALTAPA